MAICSSGVSAPKPGVAASVVVDSAFVKTLLPAGLAWLYDFIPYMSALEIGNVATFCAADPPTFTVPTGPQMLTWLLAGGANGMGALSSADPVSNFMQQVVQRYIWYQICQCTSVATPAPPAPPAAPAGLPALNPPGLVSTQGAPCVSVTSTQPMAPGNVVVWDTLRIPDGFNSGAGVFATSIDATMSVNAAGAVHPPITFRFTIENTFSATTPDDELQRLFYTVGSGQTLKVTIPIVSKGVGNVLSPSFLDVWATDSTGTSTDTVTVQVTEWCNGVGPNQSTQQCCPTDPSVLAKLDQIMTLVTLVQRQAVPFGYILGAVHPGLSGAGAISINGLLGVKVAVTTLPASYGVAGTSPPEHFDLGFVTFGTPDGFPSAYRLTRNPQIMTPRFCSAYTDLDYDLAPGVIVTITEIKREP